MIGALAASTFYEDPVKSASASKTCSESELEKEGLITEKSDAIITNELPPPKRLDSSSDYDKSSKVDMLRAVCRQFIRPFILFHFVNLLFTGYGLGLVYGYMYMLLER